MQRVTKHVVRLIGGCLAATVLVAYAGEGDGSSAIVPSVVSNAALVGQQKRDVTVQRLIVKLKNAPAASNATGARGIASVDAGKNAIEQVIARVTAKRRLAAAGIGSRQPKAVATNDIQFLRAMSGGASVLSLKDRLSGGDARALIRDFEADASVEYAEADRRLRANVEPTDPRYKEQWGYFDKVGGVNLPAAWDITTGSSAVVVAVIDTGYRPHADLAGNILPGYNFISDISTGNTGTGRSADASDPGDWVTQAEIDDPSSPFYQCQASESNSSWHGTHVAGTIGALSNNGIGGVGTSWQGKILPVRVLGKCGGTLSDIIDGMRWAAGLAVPGVPANTLPAQVLNMSLGGGGACSRAQQDAITAIIKAGVSVVVAAGNESQDVANSNPGNCNGVIAVAATTREGSKASFSNFGKGVTISAPGVEILSTVDTGTRQPQGDGYASYDGTSMATPQVAGIVALMLAVNSKLRPADVITAVKQTARVFPSGSSCTTTSCGAGIIDAGAAVKAVLSQ